MTKRIGYTLSAMVMIIVFIGNVAGCASSRPAKVAKPDKIKSEVKKKRSSRDVKFIYAADLHEEDAGLANYQIGVDDILEIYVWQIDELHTEVTVRPDGKISFPLIGDVQAEGRTVEELRQEMTDRLRLYIKAPQVSINIKELGGKLVVTLGKVMSPGIIRFNRLTKLSGAIALAGGLEKGGSKGAIFIIRDLDRERPTIILADLGKVIFQGDLREDLLIKDGDIIYVQTSLLASTQAFLDEFVGSTFDVLVGYAESYYGGVWRRYAYKAGGGRRWTWQK